MRHATSTRRLAVAAVALLCAWHAAAVVPTPAAKPNVYRQGHSATVLNNGQVLFSGSSFPYDVHSSETYDADADTWTRVGGMRLARITPATVLLPTGRVLSAGGSVGFVPTNTAESYDPASRTWSDVPAMAVARGGPRAVTIPAGVLVTGGMVDSQNATASVELFDPFANAWRTVREMGVRRSEHVAVRLNDGRVLVAGGFSLASAEVYDPAADIWTAVAAMTSARRAATATVLADGRVLVIGGYGSTGASLKSAEIYDPQANAWTPTGAPSRPRVEHTATLLPHGRVLVTGGASGLAINAAIEIYDPASGVFTAAGDLLVNRSLHSATLLPNGRVLVAGGGYGPSEIIDVAPAMFTAAATPGPMRTWHAVTTLADGRVLVTGGYEAGAITASAWLFDPPSGAWAPVAPLPVERAFHTATLLPDGRVLLAGGVNAGAAQFEAHVYSPATNSWASAGATNIPYLSHCAVVLNDGRVLVVGRSDFEPSEASVYEPATNSWSSGGFLSTGRVRGTCARLADGRVMHASGYAGPPGPNGLLLDRTDVDIYDASANAWLPAAPLKWPRTDARSVTLPDGRALVVGGFNNFNTVFPTTEIYDPRSDEWVTGAELAPNQGEQRVVVALSGEAMRVSRYAGAEAVDRFDPGTKSWQPLGALLAGRVMHEVVALADGGLLVVGGMTPNLAASVGAERLLRPPLPDARRPVVTAVPHVVTLPNGIEVDGIGFTGRPPNAGGFDASHAPVVRVQRIGDGSIAALAVGNVPFHAGHFTSAPQRALGQGWYWLTVTVDGVQSAPATFVVRNTLPAPPSTIEFALSAYEVGEADGKATLIAMRQGDCTAGASIAVQVVSGSAVAGTDFVLPTAPVSWGAGDCFPKTVSVAIKDNASSDGNRSFDLRLTNPVNATVGARAQATVSIIDEDTAATSMPGSATIVDNPYGPLTVQGVTMNGASLTGWTKNAVLQLGPNPGPLGAVRIDFDGMSVGRGNRLVVRAGAPDQEILLNNVNPTMRTFIAGTIVAESNGAIPAPKLHLHNDQGISLDSSGRVSAPNGLLVDALGVSWTTGSQVANEGTLDGGPGLQVMARTINGSGFFRANTLLLSTFGNANNPVYSARYHANGLNVAPSSGSSVSVALNGYGSAPQVFNVMVHGDATVQMPRYSFAYPGLPQNNLPFNGTLDAPYGGGSMIFQATGALSLTPVGGADFTFPGGIVLRSAKRLDLSGVYFDNGWTGSGRTFQGVFLEAPDIANTTNGASPQIFVITNNRNWVNFSTVPRTWVQITQVNGTGSNLQYVDASATAPHLNAYSIVQEIAASGGCWTCVVNPVPVNLQ